MYKQTNQVMWESRGREGIKFVSMQRVSKITPQCSTPQIKIKKVNRSSEYASCSPCFNLLPKLCIEQGYMHINQRVHESLFFLTFNVKDAGKKDDKANQTL